MKSRYSSHAHPQSRMGVGSMVVMLFLVLSWNVVANEPIFATDKVALSGFDVVAYFTEGQPVKGDPVLAYQWQGVDWFFASDEHRNLFIQNPTQYVPKYGGFCAMGAAHGALVPSSPNAWSIHNGELILNMSKAVVETWRYNPDINIERADSNWPAMRERYISSKVAK